MAGLAACSTAQHAPAKGRRRWARRSITGHIAASHSTPRPIIDVKDVMTRSSAASCTADDTYLQAGLERAPERQSLAICCRTAHWALVTRFENRSRRRYISHNDGERVINQMALQAIYYLFFAL
jgi:hypothetical protein